MEKISRLTPKFEFSSASTPTNSPALLTANTQLVSNSKANGGRGAASTPVVLFRLEHHSVDKMRTFYSDCELDAGGLPVILLTGVRPAESVALLETRTALDAIAMHDNPAADAALERFGNPSQSEKVCEKLGFALAAFRGKKVSTSSSA